MTSLLDTLGRAALYLPRGLVGERRQHALYEALSRLPARLGNWLYFEVRLADADDRVDLIVRVDREGRALLAGKQGAWPCLSRAPGWLPIVHLCRRLEEPDLEGSGGVQALWLEFDLILTEEVRLPPPGVFVDVEPSERGTRAAGIAVASLRQETVNHDFLKAVEACRSALPPGAFLPYLGHFPHRVSNALRLCVAGLTRHTLIPYLRRLGWEAADLEHRLHGVRESRADAPEPDPLLLHLDVVPGGLGDSIGLEYVCTRSEQLRGGVVERRFLRFLIEQGLAAQRKVEALHAWPGLSPERFTDEARESLVGRRLNHVKLVATRSGALEAKAYLSAHAVPRPPRRRPVPELLPSSAAPLL